jgi:uncharacterized cupredoxin-like copper-binding protein
VAKEDALASFRRSTAWSAGIVLAAGLILGACGGEDRPSVDVIDGGTSSASSSSSGSASGAPIEPGVVETKPADATEVDVTLREWAVEPQQKSVQAGKVYFLATNAGPEDAHEMVIVKTGKAPDALPVEDHKVPEGDIDLVEEIEPFAANSRASKTVDLSKGSYVLICNITGIENGETESHYEKGMRVAFTVE